MFDFLQNISKYPGLNFRTYINLCVDLMLSCTETWAEREREITLDLPAQVSCTQ